MFRTSLRTTIDPINSGDLTLILQLVPNMLTFRKKPRCTETWILKGVFLLNRGILKTEPSMHKLNTGF